MASVAWANRTPKAREVADVVCLVDDLPGYLSAISTWDRDHAFPILFDDSDFSLKFLRAFRPGRVIRLPARSRPIAEGSLWQRVVQAVGRSWAPPGSLDVQAGDEWPRGFPASVPGVVFSSPNASSMPGAAALAAGHFEPILRWEPGKAFDDVLSLAEAKVLIGDLKARVAIRFPKHEGLGDDCDFVTLAGDYPYSYDDARGPLPGPSAFDDRIGTVPGTERRWAYAGRLLGDHASSTFRAMASLFLDTDSAALIDGYDDRTAPWSVYAMPRAERRLSPLFPVTTRSGPAEASPEGWRRFFAAGNPFGLVLINSSGTPDRFNLRGGQGGLADVPEGVPCVVHKIHSFSASDPRNPSTLAGRWLDSGAYVYFGAMNEPYLTSFRTPALVADLIAEGLPLSAAFRQGQSGEAFGAPWRLAYLGDPLCTIRPRADRRPRVAWQALDSWPPEVRPARTAGEDDEARLAWARADSTLRATGGASVAASKDCVDVLLSIRRDRLLAASKGRFDALLAACSVGTYRVDEVLSRLSSISATERPRTVVRALEHAARPGVRRDGR